jgi:hypothetical protein
VDLVDIDIELDVVTVVMIAVFDMPGLRLLLRHDDDYVVKATKRNWQDN